MLNKSPDSNSTPKYFFNFITDISAEDIINMGCRAVAVDIDNTIAEDSTYKIFPGVSAWLSEMKSAEIPVVILSNTYKRRARKISAMLGIPAIGKAGKPESSGYLRAAELCGVDIRELAMVGDQLFTDIQGANNAGAVSLRVRPKKREILLGLRYRLLRRRENIYLRAHNKGDKI